MRPATSHVRRSPEILAALAIAVIGASLTLPGARARWWLSQDAVEHLAIAWDWVEGAGFVDPIAWLYPNPSGPPYPGIALRAPVVSLLVSLPFALGATLAGVGVFHVLWASGVAGLLVFAARRSGASRPAAFAAALCLATAPAWQGIALHVWTEATGLFGFLLVLMTLRGVPQSVPRALICAAATFFASLCRPNLIALGLAVVVAAALEVGARRSITSRPLLAYVIGLGAASFAYHALAVSTLGEGPHTRYGTLFLVLTTAEAWDYARTVPTLLDFLVGHAAEILERSIDTFSKLVETLWLDPAYHGLGWIALPGFAWAMRATGEGRLERRFAAFSGIGLALVAILYLDFDATRFPLFTAATAALCGFAWLDARLDASPLARRVAGTAYERALPLAPIALACLPLLTTLPGSVARVGTWRDAHRARGTAEVLWAEGDAAIRPLCAAMEPDARVASVDPWETSFWCGNASAMLPRDIAQPGVLERFLANERPAYVVGEVDDATLRTAAALERIATNGPFVVYAVREADPAAGPWTAPPPLACAGRTRDCTRAWGHRSGR